MWFSRALLNTINLFTWLNCFRVRNPFKVGDTRYAVVRAALWITTKNFGCLNFFFLFTQRSSSFRKFRLHRLRQLIDSRLSVVFHDENYFGGRKFMVVFFPYNSCRRKKRNRATKGRVLSRHFRRIIIVRRPPETLIIQGDGARACFEKTNGLNKLLLLRVPRRTISWFAHYLVRTHLLRLSDVCVRTRSSIGNGKGRRTKENNNVLKKKMIFRSV